MNYKDHRRDGKVTTSRDSDNFRVIDKVEKGYLVIREQLDQLWHDIDGGKFGTDAKSGTWYSSIKTVKERFPKP